MTPTERPEEKLGERFAAKFSAPIIELNLPNELAEIRDGDAYRGADHAAKTLVNEAELRVVLIALRPQGRLPEHRAHAPIVLHVLEGHLRLGIDKRMLELAPGGLVAIDADLPHDVEALGESAVLLIIGGKHGLPPAE
ncbi:MAG: hypothetical protein DLM67_15000 [Candidatus Nephthysia bennettiae]|nr:MAG: hypothetical protein DLM67_15000 [Candidatus Dormibacteraeota bacterium]